MVEQNLLGKQSILFEMGCANNPEQSQSWAQQASELLFKLGGEHTFQPPAALLHFALGIGHAIVAMNPAFSDKNIAGFVKMTPWVVPASEVHISEKKGSMAENETDFQSIHDGHTIPVCVEIGSLVVETSNQGQDLGKKLVNRMVDLSDRWYPDIHKIAVVTNDNIASLKVFERLQWKKISKADAITQFGIDVLEGWEPESTIFVYQGEKKI